MCARSVVATNMALTCSQRHFFLTLKSVCTVTLVCRCKTPELDTDRDQGVA